MTTFSHCTIEEIGSHIQYDAENLEDADEKWTDEWDQDEYDEDGLINVFRYEDVRGSDIASLFSKLQTIAEQWGVEFDTKKIVEIAAYSKDMTASGAGAVKNQQLSLAP